jgi:hypothetical protein
VGALSVLRLIPIGVFDEATIRTIGKTFDGACKELHDGGQPAVVHEVIIKRIIAAARKGERNVTRLRDAALTGRARTHSGLATAKRYGYNPPIGESRAWYVEARSYVMAT